MKSRRASSWTPPPRWNQPRAIDATSAQWTALALQDVNWRAEIDFRALGDDSFFVGLVTSMARTHAQQRAKRPLDRSVLQSVAIEALEAVFGADPHDQQYWSDRLQVLAQDSARRRGVDVGKWIVLAAWESDALPEDVIEVADNWLAHHPLNLLYALAGESDGERRSFALRELLVIERLAPQRALVPR